MIQRYGYLFNQVYYLNSYLQNHGLCQKIFSTPHFLCFSLRRPSETLWLYLGRGSDYQGLWTSKSPPSPSIRVQDTFLSLVRKHMISPWNEIMLDQLDRIICLKGNYFGKFQYFLFFWHGYDSYFLQHYYDVEKNTWIIHKSWDSKNKVQSEFELKLEDLFALFDEVGRKNLTDKTLPTQEDTHKVCAHQIEMYFAKMENSTTSNSASLKQLKKIKNIKSDIEKLSQFKELQKYLDTYPEAIPDILNFNGLKIKFEAHLTTEQRRNLAYNKLKNWRKNFDFMNERLAGEEVEKKVVVGLSKEIKIIKPIWKSGSSKKTVEPSTTLQDCTFYQNSIFNVVIALGKTAEANDRLRNSWSHKNDYWFHLADQPSAHLYLRFQDQINLNMELLNLVGSILLAQSKSNATTGNLIYCLAKDIKAIKGKAGSVRYKNEKRVMIFFDADWKNKVL